ncbi:hypothetical protein ARC20_12905 [Stenotrophomonas panacihumi]|uniref:Sel1 repeat family protein n=1 Tax=Stenotrophomonas panacihumi TaxID=676599 RepID=A0A0R0AFB7_9GAMM|nr:sel1 repeat family protein [Stenotrophomonas panacihumi]KRG40714.1 hypothetical protein ARC20_12905 [Stenotrophomonas panacihumi]PTN53765.1 sel1 repeat family protein [Stenotrophomonas panacihumi]
MRRLLIVGTFVLMGLLAWQVTHRPRPPFPALPAQMEATAPAEATPSYTPEARESAPASRQPSDILSTQRLPDIPAAQLAESLASRAQAGDSQAASQLYLVLSRCNHLARDTSIDWRPEYMDPALLDRLGMSEAQLLAGLEWNALASEAAELEDCQNIPADRLRQASTWLERAAREGDPYARLVYADSVQDLVGGPREMLAAPEKVAQFRRDAITYLQAVAATGSPEAMARLAAAYSSGVLVERDPLLAHAYEIAAAAAAGSAIPASAVETELSSQELARARTLAREIAKP